MSLSTGQLPVLVDDKLLSCDSCAQKFYMDATVGVEKTEQMWTCATTPNRMQYAQRMRSRIVCSRCIGLQTWPCVEARICYFETRDQYFLREKDDAFLEAYRIAIKEHERLENAHRTQLVKAGLGSQAAQCKHNESLLRGLMRAKVALRITQAQASALERE